MKKAILSLILLTASTLAMAEHSWNLDSCMENVMRQFTCRINNQSVSVDLESDATELTYKSVRKSADKIYGIYVEKTAGGKLYVSCDDSANLERVQFVKNGISKLVSCIAQDL